ncbi:MAG: MIP/aquaporin family protein [Henriciella sp.]|uniref:aquaporin n=1 Tax=Henriciella sp. TaxID=1968823 RepID=UPI003C727ED5
MTTARKYLAEFFGSLLLSGVVIGSGILALDLSAGNDAVALIGNTAATGAILWVLVAVLAPISGAHFNPAVTLGFLIRREILLPDAAAYVLIQVAGCVAGAWLAHAMFELPLLQIAATDRSGAAKMLAEGVATFALVFAIFGAIRHSPKAVPAAVALTITAGYWWTASTSFANPAITAARALSDTFAGVRPADVPGFVVAQLIGAVLATGVSAVLFGARGKA